MTANDQLELQDAIKRGWLRDRPRKNHDLHNSYHRWCKSNDRPFVVVNARQRYASVSIDMFSVDRDLNEAAVDAVKDLLMPFLARGKFVAYGRTYSGAQHVPIKHADDLAAALLRVASNPKNTQGVRWARSRSPHQPRPAADHVLAAERKSPSACSRLVADVETAGGELS